MAGALFTPITALPTDILHLEHESISQNFTMVERLRKEWDAGLNRFDADGELLVGAFRGNRLVGVGGLNRDPYAGDPTVGRLRHIYVLNEERRCGIGQGLVARLLEDANKHFHLVRLWTGAASAFYDRLGFETIKEYKATHCLRFRSSSNPYTQR